MSDRKILSGILQMKVPLTLMQVRELNFLESYRSQCYGCR